MFPKSKIGFTCFWIVGETKLRWGERGKSRGTTKKEPEKKEKEGPPSSRKPGGWQQGFGNLA